MCKQNEEKRLIEYQKDSGILDIFFNGFDFQSDFLAIVKILKDYVKPTEIDYGLSWEDASGYFVKDCIRVEIECNLVGNMWIYQSTGTEQELEKVRGWARLVWDKLMEQPMQ